MTKMKFLVLLLLALSLSGCISSTYLTIKFGAGYGDNDVVKVENIFEGAGLSRGYFIKDGKLAPRDVRKGTLSSTFYSETIHGFRAEVWLDRADGALSCRVYQIGVKRFDESAQQSVAKITGQSVKIFGEHINITSETKNGAYFL
jgi:hypothetical protein